MGPANRALSQSHAVPNEAVLCADRRGGFAAVSGFEKLGFFGVQLQTRTGAAEFLSRSRSILGDRQTALWITPEGRFADVRDHDASLQPGLAHLCSKSDHLIALPLALEYVFWEERLPVCLAAIGVPQVSSEAPGRSKRIGLAI